MSLVTRASNGCPTSFLTANSVFVLTALNLPGWHRGREYLREQFWGRCYFSFTSMIFLLNLRVVVLFLLMTPPVHAASSDSKLSCARISADLDVAVEYHVNFSFNFHLTAVLFSSYTCSILFLTPVLFSFSTCKTRFKMLKSFPFFPYFFLFPCSLLHPQRYFTAYGPYASLAAMFSNRVRHFDCVINRGC